MLTVATWNVENLFLPGTGGTKLSRAAYRRKLAYLAETVAHAGVDILALQEIGGEEELADLARAVTRKSGVGYDSFAAGRSDARGIRVAVLSRYPIDEARDWVDFPDGALHNIPDPDGGQLDTMGRGLLEVVINLADADTRGDQLRVLTCHLKSKLLTFEDGRRYPRDEDERARGAGYALMRRTAEAAAVRVWTNELMTTDRDTPVILAGDMNDTQTAVTTSMLAGPEDGDPARPDRGDPVRLYNLEDRIPAGRRYSRIYRDRPELIDHILVPRPVLLAGVRADSLVDDITGITESLRARESAVVPDHACVVATLSW